MICGIPDSPLLATAALYNGGLERIVKDVLAHFDHGGAKLFRVAVTTSPGREEYVVDDPSTGFSSCENQVIYPLANRTGIERYVTLLLISEPTWSL